MSSTTVGSTSLHHRKSTSCFYLEKGKMAYIAEKVNFHCLQGIYPNSTRAYSLEATPVIVYILVLESQRDDLLTFSSLTLWHHHVANMGFILLKKQNNPIISLIKWVEKIQKRRKHSASASIELKGWSFVWWNAAHGHNTNCCSAKPGRLAFYKVNKILKWHSNLLLLLKCKCLHSIFWKSVLLLIAKEVLQSNSCKHVKLKRDKRGKAKETVISNCY